MTDYWVSQSNYWCEYCKVWLKDTAQSRATHEKGVKHQENVAKRLRDMRRKAGEEKKEAEQMSKNMKAIESTAAEQYARDQAEAARHKAQTLGEWVLGEDTGYHYNALHRWYYDTGSKMYYGGEPPEWTAAPSGLPHAARFEVMYPPLPVAAAPPPRTTTAAQQRQLSKHPLADVGGHAMPSIGRIGAAKGLGTAEEQAASAKRKRELEAAAAGGGPKKVDKSLPKEEQEALARREAARARVQQRTMAGFGLL